MGVLFPKISDQSRKIKLGEPNPLYCDNKVDTTKYNLITYIPKSLMVQFFRLSNVVFLINAVLQTIPIISSLKPVTAFGPLTFVLAISMLREGYEDYKRHKKDWQINSRTTSILKNGIFQQVEWDSLKVGDFVKVRNGQIIPADILLLYSSEENSICYVQTSNLDGQTNLKQKFAFTDTVKLYPTQFESMDGHCLVDVPKSNLYDFDGEIKINNQESHFIGYRNLVLRETVLKNTDQVVGVALYCGYDTKILKNAGQINHKVSRVEAKLNYIQAGLVALLLVLCIISSVGYYLVHYSSNLRQATTYIPTTVLNLSGQSTVMFFTVFLLLNFLIPITLNMLIQGIKTFSGVFLSFDRKLYDKKLKKYCGVLNTSIIQQLGVVDCILTDKTGTLTANEMVFKTIAIEQRIYTRELIQQSYDVLKQNKDFDQFWISMIICHDVVRDRHKQEYQGSSPDEVCFVEFANSIGYTFVKRTKNYIEVKVHGEKRVYELIQIIPFSSRKRMSVIVRNTCNQNQLIVYTKGADASIFQKAIVSKQQEVFSYNLNAFAKEGLRTLVFSKRIIKYDQYGDLVAKRKALKMQFKQKIITKEERATLQNQIIEEIQNNLHILGSTGIEDKLQEDVPQTIHRLQKAGIRVMMITGDKLQTAENIGYLAHLIDQKYQVIKLSADTHNIRSESQKIIYQIQTKRKNVCIIIEGRQIGKIIKEQDPFYINIYSRILTHAKSVIFCRTSPKQKALIVKFVKKNMNLVVLAIGDGGNDVGMIEQAHIGVGIIGKEGNSASAVSDFSIGKFKFLDRLILHHGRWFYYRLSYFFIFFGWKNVIITLCIFFYLIESAFSGNFNFTQFFYASFNSLFGVPLLVYFGLYQQDVNDDLQPIVWKYLPQIYKQSKKKQQFSYQRYVLWCFIGGIFSVLIYYTIRYSLDPLSSIDETGRMPDIYSSRLANGIALTIVIFLVNYLDVKTHTYFYMIFVMLFLTCFTSIVFFIIQNYVQDLDYYLFYNDYFTIKFWLIIFLISSFTYLSKIAVNTYYQQFQSSIVDCYVTAKYEGRQDLQSVLIDAIREEQMREKQEKVCADKKGKEEELISSKLDEMKDSVQISNKKDASSTENMICKRFTNSFDASTQEQFCKSNAKEEEVNIQNLQNFDSEELFNIKINKK